MTSPNSRLKQFIGLKFKSNRAFAKAMGINNSSDVSKYTKKSGSVFTSIENIRKLSSLGLNIDWYLTGEGEMLLPSNDKVEPDKKRTTQLPDLKNMTTNEIRELLKWVDDNYEKMKSIVEALDSK